MKKLLNRFEKLKNRLYMMYIAPRKEKEFVSEGEKIHYLVYKKRSRNLIVVFSAYNDNGPRYDYISSLSGMNASRLYIKDDFVAKTGNYYLGRNGNYNIEKAVFALIRQKKEEFGDIMQVYIRGDAAPAGRFRYVYRVK